MKAIPAFFAIVIFTSCAGPKHRPYFFSNSDDVVEKKEAISHLRIKVDDVIDHRDYDSSPAQKLGPKISTQYGTMCINSTKRYHKRYWTELSRITNIYLSRFLGVGRVSQVIDEYDYRVSVSISDLWMMQEYPERENEVLKTDHSVEPVVIVTVSENVAILAGAVGLIYLLSSSEGEDLYATKADLEITLDSINIYDSNDVLVHSIVDSRLVIEEQEFIADLECRCTFYSLDYQYKQLLMQLAPQIEEQLIQLEAGKR